MEEELTVSDIRKTVSEQIGIWRCCGASLLGESHREKEQPCQDFFGIVSKNNALAVIIADGLGSAKNSGIGAELVVESMQSQIEAFDSENLDEEALRTFVQKAQKSLLEYVETTPDVSYRSLACTLSVVIVFEEKYLCGNIGDSGFVLEAETAEGREFFVPCEIQRGEYANQTNSITGKDALEKFEAKVIEKIITGIAGMTDGIFELGVRIRDQRVKERFFVPLFGVLRQEELPDFSSIFLEFLQGERVNEATRDDKTLVLCSL